MAMALQIRMIDVGDAHHSGATIHSGHYMMSCLDETSDDTDYYGYTTASEVECQHYRPLSQQEQLFVKQQSNGSSIRTTDARMFCFIENNLAELLQYMTLTYNGTLPSPKWKDFKGIKLKLRQKIRLNNIIWREWHMQYIKFKNPVVCQFDVPTSDRTHNKPEAVVLEGKYCKRRLESLAVEYNRWRLFAKQKHMLIQYEEDMQKKFMRDNDGQLDSFMSIFQSFEEEERMQAETEADSKRLDFNNDRLFTSLAQPFAFPCAKEIAAEARNYFSSEMIVQPGLIQLQPNLPENLASYEMKASRPLENCQKVNRRNPILSSLLMGSSSSSSSFSSRVSGSVTEKPQLQLAALPLLSNQGQGMASKSADVFLSSPERRSMPFNQFSNETFSITDAVNYLPNTSSPLSMTFIKQDLQPEISTFSFGLPSSSLSYPAVPPSSAPPIPTNHLRALLQGSSDYKFQKDEILTGLMSSHCNPSVLSLPTRRRKSTGQTSPGASSLQACNKSIQRLIDTESQERSCRRASTGTLSPTGALMSSGSEVFAVPQKMRKLKSHSVGSQQPPESPQMNVRRRKTSCIAQGSFQVNYLDEDTEVLVGNCGINRHFAGSPSIGMSCPRAPGLVTDVDQSALWDLSLMSHVQPLQGNCHFESEPLDCEVSSSSSNSMNTSQLVSLAICGAGADIGRASDSLSLASGMALHHQCSNEDCGSFNDELNEFRVGSQPELDQQQPPQQPQQHVEQRRVLHLSSEQKRRVSINSGFERLEELIRSSGEKPSSKSSKSVTLHKSAQFIRNLQNDRVKLHNEMERLQNEIQLLQDDLNLLQANLPVSGCLPQIRPKTELMCDMYNEFVRTRTHSNWKFWIFGHLMRPMYESYIHSLSSVFASNLGQAIKYWLDQHCSLAILRPACSNELREICKKTSLINNPSKLPQEALEAVGCPIIYKPD